MSRKNFARKRIAALVALAFIPAQVWAEETTATPELQEQSSKNLSANQVSAASDIGGSALPEVEAKAARIYPGAPDDVARTGSKTDTPLRDIPASVSVVPAELLEEQGAYTMNDAMRNVSSVQPVMGGGYGFANNYTSRGLSLTFLRDELPDGPTQNGYFRTMYDVERIEVLKGPGSALFGPTGPGGTINVVTKKPQQAFNLSVGTTFGSFDTKNAWVDVTGALSENVAGRLIVDAEHTEGYRGLGREILEFQPSLTFQIAEDKLLTLDIDHREIKVTPDNYGILFDNRGKIAAVSDETRYYSPFNRTEQDIDRVRLTHDWALSDALSLRTALVYETRDLEIVRNAGGGAANAANASTGRTIYQQFDDARYTTIQNELIWKTSTGPVKHTILSGVEYKNTQADATRTHYDLPRINDIFNPVIPERSLADGTINPGRSFDREIESETVSFYAQDQLAFGEHFKIRAGLRNDRVHYWDEGLQGLIFREIDKVSHLTSWSLGAVYQPTTSLAFYTGYSEGAFINLATEAQAVPLQPEESEQIEVGAKTTLLSGKVDLNLAWFKTKRENYFILLPGAVDPTPEGIDESDGIEMDVAIHPLPGWNINANAVWMDPETRSDTLASNATFGVLNQSIYGTRPTGVSRQTYSIWNSYQIQGGPARGLTFGLGITHKSDAYADNLNLYKVPSYTVYDAAVSYRHSQWEAALNLKNLTDKTYYTNPTFAGALPGDPRSLYATLRYDFK